MPDPLAAARAEYKPLQLAEAIKAGFTTPRTLITNNPRQAREFAASCQNGTVYKTLHGGPRSEAGHRVNLWTTRVTPDECGEDSVSGTAHLFQEAVPKAFDVRVTVVGNDVFAARVTTTRAGGDDWRADPDNVSFSLIDVPQPVASAAVDLTRGLGLWFGALDLIVTTDERWVFLELNPNGQWAFISELCDPITHAITDLLTQDAL